MPPFSEKHKRTGATWYGDASMKVALFSEASLLSLGGGEQGMILAANYLARQGDKVTIFNNTRVLPAKRASHEDIRQLTTLTVKELGGLPVFGIEQLPLTRTYLSALISLRGFDVIYSNNTSIFHTSSIRLIAFAYKKRTIFELSDPSLDPNTMGRASLAERFVKVARRLSLSRFGVVRVLNSSDLRRYSRKAKHVVLLHPPGNRQMVGNPRETGVFRVLFAARADPYQKGIDLLRKVVNHTKQSGKTIHFVILGGGGKGEDAIRDIARENPDNVEWKGFVSESELLNAFTMAQLFLSTSRFEAFSSAVLEAQKQGLPVVAFDIPGVAEIIMSESQGTLARPFDTVALSRAIISYYDSWSSDSVEYLRRRNEIARTADEQFNSNTLLESLRRLLLGRL